MQTLTKDAKGFIEGVVSYLSKDKSTPSVMPRVTTLLHSVSSQAKKERVATVVSAVSLTISETKDIARLLSRLLGHEVDIHAIVDTHIVGGLRIQLADWSIDTSLDHQLREMTQSFNT